MPTLWVLVIATGVVSWPDFADPLQARQLAVAVEPVTAGEDGLPADVAMGHDHGDARANGTMAGIERSFALDQRRDADRDRRPRR